MNLKQIELYGFKSFADRQIIKFECGFIGIVGPNGSGKSNVVDAVRWCLGEQSTKNIRGKNMQNMIFGGTENRKSMSYAEVSLYFDNTDRSFNSDMDEIIITRKLYRSGDSEYYINRESARLRDIYDFFRDTGVGKEGYSIVGQGKIAEIMRAKPEDLRVMFEEAAGISKMKFSKRDAEKKLDETNYNLERLKDKLDVLGADMPNLERKAENALKAREFRKILQEQEINSYVYQREHNDEEKEKVTAKIDALNAEYLKQSSIYDAMSKQEQDFEKDVTTLDQQYTDAYGDYMAKSMAKLSGDKDKESLNNELNTKTKALTRLKYDINSTESEISAKTDNIKALEVEKEGLLKDLVSAGREDVDMKNRYAEADKLVKQKTDDLRDANEFILQHTNKHGDINARVFSLDTAISMIERQLDEQTKKYDIGKSQLSSVEKNLKSLGDGFYAMVDDRNKKLSVREKQKKEHFDALGELDDYREKKSALSVECGSLRSKIQMLEDLKKNYEGFNVAVKTIMNSQREDIKNCVLGIVGEVITVSKQYQAAISAALGPAINNIITRDTYDTGILIDFLKRTRGGSNTFLPLETIKPHSLNSECEGVLDEEGCYGLAKDLIRYDRIYNPVFNSLLGATVVFDTYDNAARAMKRYRSSFKIVTMDGDVLATTGAITGGSRTVQASDAILSRDVQLKEYTISLKKNENELSVLTDEIADIEEKIKKLENSVGVLDGQISKLDKDVAAEEQKKNNLEEEKNRLLVEVNSLEEQIKQYKAELKEKKAECENAKSSLSTENELKLNASDVKQKLETELLKAKDIFLVLQQGVGETTAKLLILQQKLEALDKTINENRAGIPILRNKFYEYDSELKTTQKELIVIQNKLEKFKDKEIDREEVDRAKDKIEEIDKKRSKIKSKLDSLRSDKMKQYNILNDIKEKNQRNQYYLEKIDDQMVLLAEDILKKYQLDYEKAKEYRLDGFDFEKSKEEIRRLDKELNKLGPVDDGSINEYKEKKEVLDTETMHHEEMCKARDDIISTIREMESEMIEKFNLSFDAISKNFEEIFVDLFGQGARAKLETEVEKGQTILDGGVRIYAVPPGKKLMEMSLLSGGEQALTAISLLFAIIKLKPMPFCILDETESALDEVNAESYAKYLKKYSTNTQFIVITHRKPTMQHAGLLYGITMQEKGISVVIPVKLEEAVAQIKNKP